jgi:hypothetical protein
MALCSGLVGSSTEVGSSVTRLTVSFEWRLVGSVVLDSGRRLAFPPLPEAPGLYRFSIEDHGGSGGVYVGETDNLRRRAQHYRTPGARQPTNPRLNAELAEALGRGVRVGVANRDGCVARP